MNASWIYLVFTSLVCAFSLFSQSSVHPAALILAAAAYWLSHLLRMRQRWAVPLQLTLLTVLHVISASHSVLPLYLIHMCMISSHFPQLHRALAVNLLLILSFDFIALSYMPVEGPRLLSLAYTSFTCVILAFLFRKYLYSMEKQKQMLASEKRHLSTHDSLTGLCNYQEFHRQLEDISASGAPFILVLIDCKDLKSLNTTAGFQGVNLILKQAAQLLRMMFPEASLIGRYGGDEFALVIQCRNMEEKKSRITGLLATEFPKLAAIEVNFGMACYPQDSTNKDELILVAEHHLYHMKRDSWLKREEHMLRSEKLRVVGELASGMAHEIRNPLTTVKGFLQLSKAGQYNVEPWYDLIMDEINRMSMLTAEFLQFSKPHVTKYRVQSIQNCVYRVISLLDSEATRLGHQIRFDHPTQDLQMLMDPDKMLQLLLNLVKNAFEAMPEQGYVHVRLHRRGGAAVIEIQDNGNGIPESELEKIFIPFYTTKDTGTGLGLSICHKIVQDHEGTIEVESVREQGTTFTMTLPLISSEEDQELQNSTPERSRISV